MNYLEKKMKQNRNKELLPFRVIRKLTKRIVDLEDRMEFLEKVLEVMLKPELINVNKVMQMQLSYQPQGYIGLTNNT